MDIEVLQESSEELAREWEALLKKSRFQNPYLTPLWNKTWLKHFGNSIDIRVMLFRGGQEGLIGLGAFSNCPREGGQGGLTLLGSDDVWDYRDLVIASGREEEVFSALARFFKEGHWDTLELRGISEFSPTFQYLPPLMRSLGLKVSQEMEEACIYLILPSSWEEFFQILDPKDRHELRRKIRRLEREAPFEIETAEPSTLPERMEVFFDLHRKSGEEKAKFMTPQMKAYFRELSASLQEKGWLRLSFLKIAGRESAALFSFDFNGTEYVYNSGYDPEFARFSPGIILAAACIRRAIEAGMHNFNLLKGKENYKYHLGGREEKIYRLRVVKD